MVLACGYVYWGWVAFFARPHQYLFGLGEADFMMNPAPLAEQRAAARRAWRFALAFQYSGMLFGGVSLGSAALAAWRERREWREWPWPTLVCLGPALFALMVTLLGAAKHTALKITLAIEAVSLFAALFELWRGKAGSSSRPLSWTVLVVSLLALLIRPLTPWE